MTTPLSVSSNIAIPTKQQGRRLLDTWRKQSLIDEQAVLFDVLDTPGEEEYECVIILALKPPPLFVRLYAASTQFICRFLTFLIYNFS
jgi:hypothetical protein